MRKPVIGVMGGGDRASAQAIDWATELGKGIAAEGWVLLSGGRDVGVMDASCRAAHDAGGFVLGILPTGDDARTSVGVDVAVITGMGSARNNINVLSSDVIVACGEAEAGTLSEIALAVKSAKPVVLLSADADVCRVLEHMGHGLVQTTATPSDAIAACRALLASSSSFARRSER